MKKAVLVQLLGADNEIINVLITGHNLKYPDFRATLNEIGYSDYKLGSWIEQEIFDIIEL